MTNLKLPRRRFLRLAAAPAVSRIARAQAYLPYRGGAPALTDLIGGQVQITFADITSSIEYVKVGKLPALAVSSVSRSDALPEVRPLADFAAWLSLRSGA